MSPESLQAQKETVPGSVLVAMANEAEREAFFAGLADEGFAVEPMASASELLQQLIADESRDTPALAILLDEDLVRDGVKRSALLSAIEAHQGSLDRVIPLVAPDRRRERWFTATSATQPTQPRLAPAGDLLSALQRIAAVAAPASPAPAPEATEPWLSIRAAATQHDWDATLYRSLLARFCERYQGFAERLADRIGEGSEEELAGELKQLSSAARNLGALPLAALAQEMGQRLRAGGPVALAGRLAELARTLEATLAAIGRRVQSSARPGWWPSAAPAETLLEPVRSVA